MVQEETGVFLLAGLHTITPSASVRGSVPSGAEPKGSEAASKRSVRDPDGAGQLEDKPGRQSLLT